MTHDKPPVGNEFQPTDLTEFVTERLGWVREIVEVKYGEDVQGDLLELLPKPTSPRSDAPGWELDADQEHKVREIARRFGINAQEDLQSGAHTDFLEGGKPWKIEAELATTDQAEVIIFGGSNYRKLGADEAEFMTVKYGARQDETEPETEYQMVRRIAEGAEGFVAHDEDKVLPFGYDIDNGQALVSGETGQFIEIGTINDKPVVLLRVNQEVQPDGSYKKQPNALDLMRVIAAAKSSVGDDETSIGFVTSNSYASRAITTVEAGLDTDRDFRVGMYGRVTIAATGGNVPAETALNQIPSEIHEIAASTLRLQARLEENS